MATRGHDNLPPLVEVVHCPDVFVSDIVRLENLGHGNVRIVMCAEQRAEDGTPQRVIVLRIIRNAASVFAASRQIDAALLEMGFVPEGDGTLN